jgi:hypothetical protein
LIPRSTKSTVVIFMHFYNRIRGIYIYERSPDELNIEQGKFENTVYLRYMERDFLILLSHQSTHFIYHRIYCFCLLPPSVMRRRMMSRKSRIDIRLPYNNKLRQSVLSWLAGVIVLMMACSSNLCVLVIWQKKIQSLRLITETKTV